MKKTQLEKYYAKGWLVWGDTRISSEDRLEAGKRFYDLYLACRFDLPIPDVTQPRVDRTPTYSVPDNIQAAREKYARALKRLKTAAEGREQIIRHVIIEDKVCPVQYITKQQYEHDLSLFKHYLNKGLDDLFYFFGGKLPLPKDRHYSNTPYFWASMGRFFDECGE